MGTAKAIVLAAALIGMIVYCTGCLEVVAAGGAAGGVAYAAGDLEVKLDATPQAVIEAAKAALKDMQITILSSAASSIDGQVEARTAQDKKITIKVRQVSTSVSHLSIRVGVFGDQAVSQSIYDKIRARLGLKS